MAMPKPKYMTKEETKKMYESNWWKDFKKRAEAAGWEVKENP